MAYPASDPLARVPRWLVVVGSSAIVLHLLAVAVNVLAAPSGPWPSMEGSSMAPPPQFAYGLGTLGPSSYLRTVKLTHNAHFASDRTWGPGVRLEIRLKDDNGQEVATVTVPDPQANPWARHRQSLLAQALGDDQPAAPPQSEVLAAPNREVPTVPIWDMSDNNKQALKVTPQHEIPRDRPVSRPSEWSLLVARSYARHLCRAHGAASAEIVRVHKDAIPPFVLFQ
jgi:hypothetical protein